MMRLACCILALFATAYATTCTNGPDINDWDSWGGYAMVPVYTAKPQPASGLTDPVLVADNRGILVFGQTGASPQSFYVLRRNQRNGVWQNPSTHALPAASTVTSNFGQTLKFVKTSDGYRWIISCAPKYKLSGGLAAASGACFFYYYNVSDSTVTYKYSILAPGMDLTAANPFGAAFGTSIAVASVSAAGDTLIIGAPSSAVTPLVNTDGAVFVYTYNTGTKKYSFSSAITTPLTSDGQQFGASLAVSADSNSLAIGAPNHQRNFTQANPLSEAGRVWVYRLSDFTLHTPKPSAGSPYSLTSPNPYFSQHFGNALAFIGSTDAYLVVGAKDRWPSNTFTNPGPGSITVFAQASLVWSEQCTWTSPSGQSAEFGYSIVAGPGSDVFVGEPGINNAWQIPSLTGSTQPQALDVTYDGVTDFPTFSYLDYAEHSDSTITLATTQGQSVWVGYLACPSGWGSQCKPCSAGCIGCSTGESGDGSCSACMFQWNSSNVNTPQCDVICPANCLSCVIDSTCATCPPDLGNLDCKSVCPAQCVTNNQLTPNNPNCNAGIFGNMTCNLGSCNQDYYGPQCLPCTGCDTGYCNDGGAGDTLKLNDGTCRRCADPTKWGPYCTKSCDTSCNWYPYSSPPTPLTQTTQDPTCDITTGQCTYCAKNYYGSVSATYGCKACDANCIASAPGGSLCDDGGGIRTSTSATLGRCSACTSSGTMGQYGYFCQNDCSSTCVPGVPYCSSGPTGSGSCTTCNSGYWGSQCTQCQCNGYCYDGVTGSGACAGCYANYWGGNGTVCTPCPSGCATNCYDVIRTTGTPPTIPNNGNCVACDTVDLWGITCGGSCPSTCTSTGGGACSSGISGTGACTTCNTGAPGYWGSSCTQCASTCSATDPNLVAKRDVDAVGYTCSAGIGGNGKCNYCLDTVTYGFFCDSSCSGLCATCSNGPNGDGHCLTCPPNMWGSDCSQTCQGCDQGNGQNYCNNDPITGNGQCTQCATNKAGHQCEFTCPAGCDSTTTGTCSTGPSGDGTCTTCPVGYWGANCDKQCSCGIGVGCAMADGACAACPMNQATFDCTVFCSQYCLNQNPANPPPSCSDGTGGTGACTSCLPNMYSADCSGTCTCATLQDCSAGLNGDGTCQACTPTTYGTRCQFTCSSYCLTCDNSPSDTAGTCLTCPNDRYGTGCLKVENCGGAAQCASCGITDDVNGGLCVGPSCPSGYWGPKCINTCAGSCDPQDANSCVNNISATVTCTSCGPNQYGSSCAACTCNTNNGVCSTGPSGTGLCTSCSPTYYGSTCSSLCTCTQGTCNNGPSGDGHCSACNSQTNYGPDCKGTCSSNCATCSNGPSGTGACLTCAANNYGTFCNLTCSPNCLTCNGGLPSGNGACTSCDATHFGPTCQACSASCATCFGGLTGNGTCKTCPPGFYGPTCTSQCPAVCSANCNDGPTGSGTCKSCSISTYGPACAGTCPAGCSSSPACNAGPTGNGACNFCDATHYGVGCASNCSSACATCNNWPNATAGAGACASCPANFYGPTCQSCPAGCPTNCFDGLGGNGTCKSCSQGKYGPLCQNTCPQGCANTCSQGPTGDGSCITCSSNAFGATCNGTCSTSCLACDFGPSGTGACTSCQLNNYGATCSSTCPAGCSGACQSNVTGNGNCISCTANNTYGTTCSSTCSANCGACSNGPTGTGACTSCPTGRFGPTCQACPTCILGCFDGITGNGTCIPPPIAIPSNINLSSVVLPSNLPTNLPTSFPTAIPTGPSAAPAKSVAALAAAVLAVVGALLL